MIHELELIDKICALDKGGTILCEKLIPLSSPIFRHHFPHCPVVPGVLLVEAMAQAGGMLIMKTLNMEKMALMVLVRRAKFSHFIKPGETMTISAKVRSLQESAAVVDAEVKVSNEKRSCAQIVFSVIDFPSIETKYMLEKRSSSHT